MSFLEMIVGGKARMCYILLAMGLGLMGTRFSKLFVCRYCCILQLNEKGSENNDRMFVKFY